MQQEAIEAVKEHVTGSGVSLMEFNKPMKQQGYTLSEPVAVGTPA